MRRFRTLRAALALVSGVGVFGVVSVGDAEADPEVCGYVRYWGETGPSSTVPYVPYCERPCGPGVGDGPHGTDEFHYELLVCLRGV